MERKDTEVQRLLEGGVPKNNEAPTSFMGRLRIKYLLEKHEDWHEKNVKIGGWLKTLRKQGGGKLVFVKISDGSSPSDMQVVVVSEIPGFDELLKLGAGCSISVTGRVVKSPAKEQDIEIILDDPENHSFTIWGGADLAAYPLSKKGHSKEFLRTIAHLRPRSYFFQMSMRMRSAMAAAVHRFYQDRGYYYIHTPLITAADCEGAGEMFQVTNLLSKAGDKIEKVPVEKGVVQYKNDFFNKAAFLTVSGQLDAEAFACAMCDVYTFGPTFRAEESHTSRHLAEFWMIEPECAFADLFDLMGLAEAFIKYCCKWALENCLDDLKYCDANVEPGLIARLENLVENKFIPLSYTEAVEELRKVPEEFEVKPEWGIDLGSEHERYLTEKVYKSAVILYNYPKDIKAFYMRANDDGKTVAAMDVLVPRIGEVIGGSQREEREDKLLAALKEKNLPEEPYWWYRDLRRFGTVPHSGFGLGFERLLMLVTGIENIRDVVPFPRYPGHAEF